MGCPAGRVFALWMRYACAAFYSHPWAWNEIGFGGPAYPQGLQEPRPRQARAVGGRRGRRGRPGALGRAGRDGQASPRPPFGSPDCGRGQPTNRRRWSRRTKRQGTSSHRWSTECGPATQSAWLLPNDGTRTNHRLRQDMRALRRRRRGRPGRRRLRGGRRRAHPAAGPPRDGGWWRSMPGRSGTPTETGSATRPGPTISTGTSPGSSRGTTRCRSGDNNSGRGVGGSMVHFAGYAPRFHPSDFATCSTDGVGRRLADRATRPAAATTPTWKRSCRSPGRTGPGVIPTGTRSRPIRSAATARPSSRGARPLGIDVPSRSGGHHQRPLRQPAALHLPRLLPPGLQGERQGLAA